MSPSTIEGVLWDIMGYNCVFYNHTVYANIVCDDDINKSIVDDSVLYDFVFCGTIVCSSVLYICMPYQHLLSYCICCGCAFGAKLRTRYTTASTTSGPPTTFGRNTVGSDIILNDEYQHLSRLAPLVSHPARFQWRMRCMGDRIVLQPRQPPHPRPAKC